MKKAAVLSIAAIGVLTTVVVVVAVLPAGRSWVKTRTKWAVVATNVYQDSVRRIGLRSGQIGNPYTSPKDLAEIPAVLKNVAATYANYLRHFDNQQPTGHVLEIGPGNNLGVALMFASAGARHVTAVDRFVPLQTSEFHRHLYSTLRAALSHDAQQRFDEAIDVSAGIRLNPARMTYLNRGIEETDRLLRPASIDLIVSNAVLEEVFDIERMFAAIDALLAPGGVQIHKIDLTDYRMFSKHGYHPLEFLTIPDSVYRYMVESTGQSNRRLIDYYRDKMHQLGYEQRIYATWLLGATHELIPPVELGGQDGVAWRHALEQVRAIKPRLLERYRRLPDEDLAVQGILLVARKPGVPSGHVASIPGAAAASPEVH
jgi:hypothetical protein